MYYLLSVNYHLLLNHQVSIPLKKPPAEAPPTPFREEQSILIVEF